MKGQMMKKLKSILMAGIMAGALMTASPGTAGSWTGAGLSAAGTLLSAALLFFTKGEVAWMPAGNWDAIQIAGETGVLLQMGNVKDKWDPEPADEYQKAAENNGGSGGGTKSGGVSLGSLTQDLPFSVASLKNVGIEAIGVGPTLAEIMTADTRSKILGELEFLQPKTSAAATQKKSDSEVPGAGDCAASYSVCLKTMNSAQEEAVVTRQKQNEQNFGTASVAHAELGLMAVQQAMANDGDGDVGKITSSQESAAASLTPGKATFVQNLKALVGTGKNTVSAMKIVSLMNLELAQRLNQGNMMQGSTLTVEASRALIKTAGITD